MKTRTRKPLASQCPSCGATTKQVRNGKNRSGSRRTRCMKCKSYYTNAPKWQHRRDTIETAIILYTHLHNYHQVAKLLGVSRQTVKNWVNNWMAVLSPILDKEAYPYSALAKRVNRLLEER